MLTILFLIIVSASVLGVILLAIVATGIRQEPSTEELSERTPNLIAVFVRRLLGVYVHKPNSPSNLTGTTEAMPQHTTPIPADPVAEPK